jgi:hypothetical protein
MNYSDVPSRSRTAYLKLKDTQHFNCDQQCLCRFSGDRSVKDKLYHKWFVLNEPVIFPSNKEGFDNSNRDSLRKEGFKQCVCSSRQGGCSENCQDVDQVENAYVSGKATEFSDRKAPGWNRGPEIGSYKFPKSCNGAPYAQHPNFGPWDFTEFGQ